jgi:hypothetical protein
MQTVTIDWKKKFLPFKAKATVEEAPGELVLTERSLVFSPQHGQPIGADVELIRVLRPDQFSLTVTYSSAGEMKSLEFAFPEGDAKDSFRFARRVLGLHPDVTVTGFRTIPNEEFKKLAMQLISLIEGREQIQDDIHTPENLILNELWDRSVFVSWPQILWNVILAFHYQTKVVENIEKGTIYNDQWNESLESAKQERDRAISDLERAGMWPPPSLSSFPLD